MARYFALLKLRLIRNGLRSPQYALLFTLGASASAVLAFLGFVFLAALRAHAFAADATLVVFAAVTLVWTVVPLIGFGTDETLDPQRLALLPLRRGQLLRGLLVAALLGVAPIATAFALTGAIVGLAHDALAVLLISLAIAGTLLLCVVASRTLIAVLAPLLRSRRGRDLLVMSVALAAFVPAVVPAVRGAAHRQRPAGVREYRGPRAIHAVRARRARGRRGRARPPARVIRRARRAGRARSAR